MAMKEYKIRSESTSVADLKREVLHEANMLNHLGNHRGLPLLFGVIANKMPLRLVTQFHGHKKQSVTLRKGLKHLKLDKPSWQGILKNIIEALDHVHKTGVLHTLKQITLCWRNETKNGIPWLSILEKPGSSTTRSP